MLQVFHPNPDKNTCTYPSPPVPPHRLIDRIRWVGGPALVLRSCLVPPLATGSSRSGAPRRAPRGGVRAQVAPATGAGIGAVGCGGVGGEWARREEGFLARSRLSGWRGHKEPSLVTRRSGWGLAPGAASAQVWPGIGVRSHLRSRVGFGAVGLWHRACILVPRCGPPSRGRCTLGGQSGVYSLSVSVSPQASVRLGLSLLWCVWADPLGPAYSTRGLGGRSGRGPSLNLAAAFL